MNEFNSQVDAGKPGATTVQAKPVATTWYKRKLIFGQAFPELGAAMALIVAAGWFFFGPSGDPSVHQLAFDEAGEAGAPMTAAVAQDVTTQPIDFSQIQGEMVKVASRQREYSEANRAAIERLAETVKSQGVALAEVEGMRQQLTELQAQNSVLSSRISSIESRPLQRSPAANSKPASAKPSPLAGMRLSAVQNGMAWVNYQNKTWAVQAGDPLGNVTVIRIDAQARQVHTSAGTIR